MVHTHYTNARDHRDSRDRIQAYETHRRGSTASAGTRQDLGNAVSAIRLGVLTKEVPLFPTFPLTLQRLFRTKTVPTADLRYPASLLILSII